MADEGRSGYDDEMKILRTSLLEKSISEGEIKTVKFLFDSSLALKSSPNTHVLRLSNLCKLDCMETLKVNKNDLRFYCGFCFHPWKDGFYKMRIIPKTNPGKGIKKLMMKREKFPGKLLKIERKLLNLADKDSGNKLVLTCLKCKKDTVKVMKKLVKIKKVISSNEDVSDKKKKKKKKKKDEFAGLNSEIVLKAAISNTEACQDTNIPLKKKKKQLKPNVRSLESSSLANLTSVVQCEEKDVKKSRKTKYANGMSSLQTKSGKVIPTRVTHVDKKINEEIRSKSDPFKSGLNMLSKEKKLEYFRELQPMKLVPEVKQQKQSLLKERRIRAEGKKKRNELLEYLSKSNKGGNLKDYLKNFGKSSTL